MARLHQANFQHPSVSKTAAIEIKSSKTLNASFFDGLKKFGNLTENPSQLFLIYGGDNDQPRSDSTVLGWRSIGKMATDFL